MTAGLKYIQFDDDIDTTPDESTGAVKPNVSFIGYLNDEQYDTVIHAINVQDTIIKDEGINVYFNATLPNITSDVTEIDITASVTYFTPSMSAFGSALEQKEAKLPLSEDEKAIIKDAMDKYCIESSGDMSLNKVLEEAKSYAAEVYEYKQNKKEADNHNYDIVNAYLTQIAKEGNYDNYEITKETNNTIKLTEISNELGKVDDCAMSINLSNDKMVEFCRSYLMEKDICIDGNNQIERNLCFGSLGNGLTVYDSSRIDPQINDFPVVAHIANEGTVSYRTKLLNDTDLNKINSMANDVKERFLKTWNSYTDQDKMFRIYDNSSPSQLIQITKENLSVSEKVAKYEHSIIFKDEPFPEFNKDNNEKKMPNPVKKSDNYER